MMAIVGFLQSFLSSKFGVGMAFVIGVAAAIGWSLFFMLDDQHKKLIAESAAKIERAEENVVKAENIAKEARQAVSDMVMQRQAELIAHARLEWEYALIEKEKNDAVEKLDSYRARWAKVAHKKPGLLARLINRATVKRVRGFAASTCRADCGETGGESGGASSARPAPANPEG